MSGYEENLKSFRKLTMIALAATYLLILIGSGIRASGAGMGCPDWPTCFGKLIPPVNESQLPSDYREIYAERGYANQPFNAGKTWLEFGNRLFGVTTGLLITIVFAYALVLLRQRPGLLILAGATLLVTGVQGWLGSVVVSSNLHPLMISSHMMLALVMIACLHSLIEMAGKPQRRLISSGLSPVLLLTAVLLIIQIAFGIGVREQIDNALVLLGTDNRHKWIALLDGGFSLHMGMAAVLLVSACVCLWLIRRQAKTELLAPLPVLWLLALGGSLVSGLSLFVLDVPPLAQPPHLFFASVQFGMLYHMIFRLIRCQSPEVANRC